MSQPAQGQRGASLVELMFSIAIGAVVLVALSKFVLKARGSMTQVEVTNELDSSDRRMTTNLRNTLRSARLLLVDYGGSPDTAPLRSAIINAINASGSPAPVSFSAPPISQDDSKLDFGSGNAPNWGNELFFVGTLPPVTLTVGVSPCASAGVAATLTNNAANAAVQQIQVSVDRLEFMALYLAQDPTHILKGGEPALRLVQWRSKPYVVNADLVELQNSCANGCVNCAVLTGTCQALLAMGYNVSVDWDSVLTLTAGAGGGYYSISGTGAISTSVAAPPLGRTSWSYVDEFEINNDFTVNNTDNGHITGQRTGSGFAGPAKYSIAYNTVTATTPVSPTVSIFHLYGRGERTGGLKVPVYASADRTATGFPGGFEVAVFGRPGAREVYMRMVQMASAALEIQQAPRDYFGMESIHYVLVQNTY